MAINNETADEDRRHHYAPHSARWGRRAHRRVFAQRGCTAPRTTRITAAIDTRIPRHPYVIVDLIIALTDFCRWATAENRTRKPGSVPYHRCLVGQGSRCCWLE